MAAVNVSNFWEFYDAITNAPDGGIYEVNCPENAIWDMNEIDPTGSISDINLRYGAYIHGNGTTLKNYHGSINKQNTGSTREENFDHFHFENMLATGESAFSRCNFSQCKISVQCGVNTRYLADYAVFLQCSINVDAQASTFRIIDVSAGTYTLSWYCQYCRIEVNAPNVTGAFPTVEADYRPGEELFCELIYHVPSAAGLQTGYQKNCTIRGEMASVTSITFRGSDQTVICSDSMDSLDIETIAEENRKWLVTDAQLRDIDYLHSIGFVIGSE